MLNKEQRHLQFIYDLELLLMYIVVKLNVCSLLRIISLLFSTPIEKLDGGFPAKISVEGESTMSGWRFSFALYLNAATGLGMRNCILELILKFSVLF
jgi:hypothetical protein